MKKCGKSALDMQTGQRVATDRVTLSGGILPCWYTLNQLQLLLRIRGKVEPVLERFLLRLDEQSLEISSPWGSSPAISLLESLLNRLHKAWLEKERWAGCLELKLQMKCAANLNGIKLCHA
jgi:hypothetical protein